MYYFTNTMVALFVQGTTPAFTNLANMDDIWTYMNGDGTVAQSANGLLDALYMEKWYNGQPVNDHQRGFVYFENKLLGLPRLR